MSFLQIHNLAKDLGEFKLKGISLELAREKYLTIIGPTGAGKTILLECLIGFYFPDKGNIFLDGREITREKPEKRHIGIVYQDYALMPHMDVYKNIAYGLRKSKKENIEPLVREIADSLEISHLLHRKPGTLSGGEQQRVALARSLVVRPQLLLMDEPLSALDPGTKKTIRSLLRQAVNKVGTTVIHVTHDMDDVWSLADEAAVLRNGYLEQKAEISEILQRPCTDFIAGFVGGTVLQGTVKENSSQLSKVEVQGSILKSADQAPKNENVRVIIRPENIILSRQVPDKVSARNVLSCKVQKIEPENGLNIVRIAAGNLQLKVLVTNNALHDLELSPGEDVYALIKCVHVRLA